jgi:Co/Zn/Cd efflux system component
VVLAALLLWSTNGLLREAGNVLLEGLPKGMHLESVARSILATSGVQEVHDIHIWTIGTDLLALSCHVCIPDMHMEESETTFTLVTQLYSSSARVSRRTPATTCLNRFSPRNRFKDPAKSTIWQICVLAVAD